MSVSAPREALEQVAFETSVTGVQPELLGRVAVSGYLYHFLWRSQSEGRFARAICGYAPSNPNTSAMRPRARWSYTIERRHLEWGAKPCSNCLAKNGQVDPVVGWFSRNAPEEGRANQRGAA